jgi:NAD(P)-dependent dehydrogenase (short-subunit alcohol dehydrogenase family)
MKRVALVTGGARGIGAAVARRLLDDGWGVVVADVDVAGADARARAVVADVGDEDSVAALVAGVRTVEGRLDGLVCNAGISRRKPVTELSLAEWNAVLATNLTSIFLLARACAGMLRDAGGAIVTVASTRAHMSEPDMEAYAASKGGVVALTHSLAMSLAPVRVNCVSPGWIATKGPAPTAEEHAFHPAGRVGRAEDVAGLVAFLLGGDAGFITGAEFVCDGGVTRKMIYPE